jgi:hypothetical protein
MKKYLFNSLKFAGFIFLLVFFATGTYAQRFGNEWIDYSQVYFKIPVFKEGIYRISANTLQSAGFPAGVDPRRIQIFHRGNEQAIYINGENDGVLDAGDYLEFYGQANDGTQDSLLYRKQGYQPHKFYNLFSDTTAYFLTYLRDDTKVGKRMAVFAETNNGLSPEAFHLENKLIVNTDIYSGVAYPGYPGEVQFSLYDQGEGWTGSLFTKGQYIDYLFDGLYSNFQSGSIKPQVEILVKGVSNYAHKLEIFAGATTTSLRSIGMIPYQNFQFNRLAFSLEWSDFSSDGKLTVRCKEIANNDTEPSVVSVSYLRLKYPQVLDANNFSQKKFYLMPNPIGKSYFEISNTASGTVVYDITDKDNVRSIGTVFSGNKLTGIVNNTLQSKTLIATAIPLTVSKIIKIGFRDINPQQYNFLIVTHPKLRKPVNGVPDVIKAYAEYRASVAGGRHDTLTVDMDLLYNQFSYGERTPVAFRRFADFMLENQSKQLYMLLIGTARSVTARQLPNSELYAQDVVPSGFYPGSDVALTSGVRNSLNYIPAIPTGRISALTPEQVLNYLNKVKEHESLSGDLWRKNILHLSGGRSQSELERFKAYTDGFKQIAEGPFFGGKVVGTITKKNTEGVEFINIADEVNKGLSYVTFFGHSAPSVTDIDIGYVSRVELGYNNKGKYPFFIINGCQSGDIYGPYGYTLPPPETFGENWIRAADKGALGFLSHSSLGLDGYLQIYTNIFYETAFGDSIYVSKPIGVIHREAVRRYVSIFKNFPDEVGAMSHAEQMILQGDPAVSMVPVSKPDYAVSGNRIFLETFNNVSLTAAIDSFRVGIVVYNLGKTDERKLSISVRRTFSDNSTTNYDTVYYDPVYYADTLYFTIRNDNFRKGGKNLFEIKVDAKNQIDELSETNNTATLEYFIPSVGAIPLFPGEYSVVNHQPVQFTAQSTINIDKQRQYILEIDTVATFNSSSKQQLFTNATNLPVWTTSLISKKDSVVYYWRIRFADQPESNENAWAESSFIYIGGSPEGWSQSDFPQFSKATLKDVVRNTNTKKWEFTPTTSVIQVKSGGAGLGSNVAELYINGNPALQGGSYGFCSNQALLGIIFDKNTAAPITIFNGWSCVKPSDVIPSYVSTVINQIPDASLTPAVLEAFLNQVKPGNFVLLISHGTVSFNNFISGSLAKLAEFGGNTDSLGRLQTGNPFIFFGQRGALPNTATEVYGNYNSTLHPNFQNISLNTTITGRKSSGLITSSLIGPASEWGTLFRDIRNTATGKWHLDVLGADLAGRESLVVSDVPTDAYQLNQISTSQFPYLRLHLNVEDTTKLVPPQLKRWQVIYKGVPEGVFNSAFLPTGVYDIPVKAEGEKLEIPFVFQNLTPTSFDDSLTVKYTLRSQTTGKDFTKIFKIKKINPLDTARFVVGFTIPAGFSGDNMLIVEVNPRILPEQNYTNNSVSVSFQVKKDNINPILDVTFDGIKIMNGDIISPSPLIAVSLKDENKFIFKTDTAGMKLLLKKCQTCSFENISLAQSDVRIVPASTNNDYRIEYKPSQKLPDGIYTLQVQGRDASGNLSGVQPYEITFQVINEASITHFYPYPNPFSSSTRFVFTLTGSEIPDQIKIQIMTVTGKVVKEILPEELGPVKIGNNISQYAWDGRDEFGDKLANGVYLYRVIVKQNGENLNRRETAGDKSFKKEFGKIYILR